MTIARFSFVQFAAQALMAFCGLLIVRTLPKEEYTLFLVANTMQGTINILSDAGASIGMTAIGGKIWQDRYRLGQLVNSTLNVRRKMQFAAVLVGAPLLLTLLCRNGATVKYAVLLTVTSLAGLYFILEANVSRFILQLHSQVGRLQRIDFAVPLLRLGLIAVSCAVFLNAVLAIAVMTLIWVFQWWWTLKWARENIEVDAPVNREDATFIRTQIRRVMPGTIFYCLQSQVYIFILSLFGRSERLAEVGALGRLAVFFSVVMTVMHSIIVPAFGRCQDPATLRRRYVQILGAFVALGTGLVGLTVLFPRPLLAILGSGYANLQQALTLSVAVTVANGLVDAMWVLNAAKGWTEHAWLNIPLQLLLQVGLFFWLDVQTVQGVLVFSLLSLLSPLAVTGTLAWRGLFMTQPTAPSAA